MVKVVIFSLGLSIGTLATFIILCFAPLEDFLHPPYCLVQSHGIDMPYPSEE